MLDPDVGDDEVRRRAGRGSVAGWGLRLEASGVRGRGDPDSPRRRHRGEGTDQNSSSSAAAPRGQPWSLPPGCGRIPLPRLSDLTGRPHRVPRVRRARETVGPVSPPPRFLTPSPEPAKTRVDERDRSRLTRVRGIMVLRKCACPIFSTVCACARWPRMATKEADKGW